MESPGDDFVYLPAFQQLVLERTHDLITVLDPTGMIVYASASWQTLTGWDPDGLLGTPILELVHPDDHRAGVHGMTDVLGGAAVDAITARLRTREGRWLSVETTGTPVYGSDGAVVYVLGTARDVHDMRSVAYCLAGKASVAALRGNAELAGELWAQAEQLEREVGERMLRHERERYERIVDLVELDPGFRQGYEAQADLRAGV